jgi:hypothetical protein
LSHDYEARDFQDGYQNRVAICLPGRVMVNGKSVTIHDGGRLGLPNCGNVIRKGNVYSVLALSGDSVRATVNNGATPNTAISMFP